MPKTKIARREFLQLAKTLSEKSKLAGWYVSEKLDGTRCFWDGGLTRGLKTESIPWASITDPKTGNKKAKIKPFSTGLWSRYGNPIIAPDWFLDKLPSHPLDGELWCGRGNFQLNRSVCAGDTPDPRFDKVQFAVYGCPPINRVFQYGEIKNTNFHRVIELDEIAKFIAACIETRKSEFVTLEDTATFEDELLALQELDGVAHLHQQIKLPNDETVARRLVDEHFNRVMDLGGEGLIIRDPNAVYTPKRVSALLKYKPENDDEGVIVGFTSGRETDKGSKLLGKIGALILDYHGKRLELAGLTDEEREFAGGVDGALHNYAWTHPGEEMPPGASGKHFKVGDRVTFIYTDFSNDGIPKNARYYRQRDEE